MDARWPAFTLAALLTIARGGAALDAHPAPLDGRGKADKPKAAVGTEAAGWLTTLRAAAPSDLSRERLVVVGPDGALLASSEGSATAVSVPIEAAGWLRNQDASISLVHNHPGNRSLSNPDLILLAHPGVARIVAVGNDGSVYEASRGPEFDVRTFEARLEREHAAFKRKLVEATAGCVKVDERIMTHFAHALALRLARLHLIEYRAILDSERQRAWDAVRIWFARADR
jgi:hypothetical protein